MYQAGLILEGGGMKGIYTAGVIDVFLEKGIEFSSCYGVSAGGNNMCSYLSKQHKRAYRVWVDYMEDKAYCSVENLIKTGDVFGVDMCYSLIPDYLDPFDYDTFAKYEGKAYSVVTNIETGKAEYIEIKDMHTDIDVIRASSSMPLVSRNVKIGDSYYLDGGIADSIPLRRSMKDGNKKNVVVMTKEEGFVRKPVDPAQLALIKVRYARYPKVYERMRERHLSYNAEVRYIEELQRRGEVFVIRPRYKSDVGRLEKDRAKMDALYEAGYNDAAECCEALIEYLEK